jgi:hypothetical protein
MFGKVCTPHCFLSGRKFTTWNPYGHDVVVNIVFLSARAGRRVSVILGTVLRKTR